MNRHTLSAVPPFCSRPTILALCISAALGISTPVLAQQDTITPPGTTANTGVRTYNIPAQPLGEALIQFGQQSGLQVTTNSGLVEGKQASAVSGSITVQQALNQLLSGTGLVYRINGAMVSIEIGGNTLPAVRVSADQLGDTTEGTGSYTTGVTNTATKLPLSPRETPQTITVVTRQEMDDFGMTNVDDVLESTSGVYIFQQGTNGSLYYSRGFEMQSQYDGISNPVGIGEWNRNPSPDSAFLDRVEILQGASGLLSGAGEPGGTVNLVRKRATREFQSHIEAQLGSWNKRRLVGDISGSLLKSGAIRGRAVAVWDDSDSFVDYVYDDKRGFYGVIDADVTATTTLNASIQYQQNDGRDHGGVPMGPDGSDLGLSRSYFFKNANSNQNKEYLLYTLSLEQKLSADWLLKAAYNHNKTDVNITNGGFIVGGPLDVATGDGLSLWQHRFLQREFTSDALDLYASGSVQFFGRRHELVLGGGSLKLKENTYNSGNVSTAVNIYSFDPSQLPTPPVLDSPFFSDSQTQQYGIYGATRLNLADPLKLILGSRVSWYEYEDGGVRTQDEDAVVSPYAGIVYDLGKQYSLYASYSDIFTPQSNLSRSGSPIDPIVGVNYESGIKGEFYNGHLNAAAAIFRLEQTNLAVADEDFGNDPTNICGGWCYIAQDKIISQGVDLSLNGELSPGWNIGTSYTYVKSEYGTGAQKGDPYRTETPEQFLRIFTSYHLPDNGWTVGGNLNVQSRYYRTGIRNGIAWRIEQGGLAIAGLMAKYQLNQHTEISLTADNIFDRRYFASANALYYVPYGEPRRFAINMKYNF